MFTSKGKKCSLCKEWRPEFYFHKHPGTKDGLQSQCKRCISVSTRVRRTTLARVAQAEPVDNADQSASLVLTGVL